MSIHNKLTSEHFELDAASKMRNHLAEDVLDRNMLELMKVIYLFSNLFIMKFMDYTIS